MPYVKFNDRDNDPHNDDGIVFPWRGKDEEKFSQTRYDYDRKLLYGTNNYTYDNNLHYSYVPVVRAAVNAIVNKTVSSLEGCTMYTTMPPDRDCAHAIIQSGISVVKYGDFHKDERTEEGDITDAMALLQHQGILLM